VDSSQLKRLASLPGVAGLFPATPIILCSLPQRPGSLGQTRRQRRCVFNAIEIDAMKLTRSGGEFRTLNIIPRSVRSAAGCLRFETIEIRCSNVRRVILVRPHFAVQTGSASRSILAKMPASCDGSRLLEHQRAACNQALCYLQLGESLARIQINTA